MGARWVWPWARWVPACWSSTVRSRRTWCGGCCWVPSWPRFSWRPRRRSREPYAPAPWPRREGPGNLGAYRVIMARAVSSDRAGLIEAISTVNYLAFGLPAVIAGMATQHFGLHATALVYSVVIALLAAAAAGGFLFAGNARTRPPRAAWQTSRMGSRASRSNARTWLECVDGQAGWRDRPSPRRGTTCCPCDRPARPERPRVRGRPPSGRRGVRRQPDRDAHLARALPARPRVAIRLGAELRHRRQGEPGRLHRRPQPGRRRCRRGAGPRLLAIRGLSRPRLAAVITAAAIWSLVPAGPATRPQPALARRLRAPGRPCADDTTSDPCWQRPDLTWEHGLGLSSDARCARCAWRASSASRAGWGIG